MTTQPGDTQHDEERRGGLGEAVKDFFRGDRDEDDRVRDHDATDRDRGYACRRV